MDKPFVLGLDLDGVCVDFYAAMRKHVAEWRGVDIDTLDENVEYGLKKWGLRDGEYSTVHRWAVLQRGLFREAPMVPGARQALRNLSDAGVHIRIITHRLFIDHFHKEAVAQTIDWLEDHAIPYRDLCFMKDKSGVGADVYLEDTPGNIDALLKAKLRVIAFTNSTNKDCDYEPRADGWENAEEMILAEFEKYRAAS